MSFFLDHIERIISTYPGNPPLAAYLKAYFRQYPKLGSRDRKALSEAAFIYYRNSRFAPAGTAVAPVIAAGMRRYGSSNVFLQKMLPPVADDEVPETIAPSGFDGILSPGLSTDKWLEAMGRQPRVFIRLRAEVARSLSLLEQHDIAWELCPVPGNPDHDCLRLAAATAVDLVLPGDAYVVQDWASQASIYTLLPYLSQPPRSVWDVCSGAGGKSLLLTDKLPPFSLLASDVRGSILHNLRERFRRYGMGKVRTRVLDSTSPEALQAALQDRKFDLVLCDVPCSGSGTWSRSPEQFHFFRESDLQRFEALQYTIAFNAAQRLAPGGILAYITCSVFRRENEEVVQRLLQATDLELLHQELLSGLDLQADALFIAVFRKP